MSLASTSSCSATSSSSTYTRDDAFALEHFERLEAAARAAARHVVGRVGEALQLVEHEAGDHQIAADHTGAREREQLAVHHHRRVDEQAVARVERLGAHERPGRQAERLEHRVALAGDDPEAEPAHDPRREPGERRRDARSGAAARTAARARARARRRRSRRACRR